MVLHFRGRQTDRERTKAIGFFQEEEINAAYPIPVVSCLRRVRGVSGLGQKLVQSKQKSWASLPNHALVVILVAIFLAKCKW